MQSSIFLCLSILSDTAVFVLKWDVKLQPTNCPVPVPSQDKLGGLWQEGHPA